MKKNILIVDDELLIAETWSLCLNLEGFDSMYVASVEEAIKEIDKQYFDLIITDLKMPGEGGESLINYLERNNVDSKVIVCSGHIDEGIFDNNGKIISIIKKPFQIEDEIFKIKAIFNL